MSLVFCHVSHLQDVKIERFRWPVMIVKLFVSNDRKDKNIQNFLKQLQTLTKSC